MTPGFPCGDPRAHAAGRRGGAASGARRRQITRDRWLRLFPLVPPEDAQRIYDRGYQAGWRQQCAGKRTTPAASREAVGTERHSVTPAAQGREI